MGVMQMMCKTGTVCLGVIEPNFIFYRICVRTVLTHMCCLLPEDLVLTLKKVLSFCPIPLLTPLLSGGHMYINTTSGSTIDLAKHGVVIIKGFIIRVNNIPPPPLCTLHHEPIVGVIYNLSSEIIVEIRLGICRPRDTFV